MVRNCKMAWARMGLGAVRPGGAVVASSCVSGEFCNALWRCISGEHAGYTYIDNRREGVSHVRN